jgi:carboxyl-terminal processing protease
MPIQVFTQKTGMRYPAGAFRVLPSAAPAKNENRLLRRSLMNRLSATVLCLAASIAGFLGAQSLNAVDNKQSAAERARQDFELMRLFADAYEQIDSHYVREVDKRELVDAAIRGMASHLDTYSTYVPPQDLSRFEQYLEQEFVGIGIHVNAVAGKLEIVSPLPGSPAFRAGLRSGDEIADIEGKSTMGMSTADVAKLLTGPAGRSVSLGIRKPNAENVIQVTVVRETIQLPTVVGMSRDAEQQWRFMLNDEQKIGYVRLTHFSRNTATELKAALETLRVLEMRALVLDLRSNPGGLMESAIEISDMFLDSGAIVSMKGRAVPERKWSAKKGNTITEVPIAVLVNRQSASASEVLSACLQDNRRAIVVGERSWGKGSVQNVIQMESGRSALKLTTASYFRPSGVNIHRFPESKKEDEWGVKPNDGHLVELSKEQWLEWTRARETIDVLHGQSSDPEFTSYKDIQLDHAVEFLISQLSTTLSDPTVIPTPEIGKVDVQ